MRELIRPVLFLVARMGICLGVPGWIIGQSWQGVVFNSVVTLAIDRSGIAFRLSPPSTEDWTIKAHENYDADLVGGSFGFGAYEVVSTLPGVHIWRLSHVARVGIWGHQIIFSTRHWFIITIFAHFYGLLKWMYRKRERTAQATDDSEYQQPGPPHDRRPDQRAS